MAKNSAGKSKILLSLTGVVPPLDSSQSDSAAAVGEKESLVETEWLAPAVTLQRSDKSQLESQTLSVSADSVVTLDYKNGLRLFLRGEEFDEAFAEVNLASRGTETADERDREFTLPVAFPPPGEEFQTADSSSRGIKEGLQWALEKIGISAAKKITEPLAESAGVEACNWFENRELNVETGEEPGLRLCSFDGEEPDLSTKVDPAKLAGDAPILLLIHGTASSTESAFRDFWASTPLGKRIRRQLESQYGNRIVAFQHRTLTLSPIRNAIDLVKSLPPKATLHIVSHSRGGLIGELLCRGNRVERTDSEWRATSPFDAKEIEECRGLLNDVGTSPNKKSDGADLLQELGDLLAVKELRIERFVRVGCPARGTTLASGKLDRWLSRVATAIKLAASGNPAFSPFVTAITEFAQAFVATRTEPDKLPGLSAQMPGSPLVQILAETDATVTSDLFVVAGRLRGTSLKSHLTTGAMKWFFGANTDAVVNTGSMYSGAWRLADGLDKEPTRGQCFFDRDTSVIHFNYFGCDSTASAMLDALAGVERVAKYPLIQPDQITVPDRKAALKLVEASSDSGSLSSKSISKVDGKRPVVIVLPGIMGSILSEADERIWISPSRLARRHLNRLKPEVSGGSVRPGPVRATAIFDSVYGDLCRFLSQSHDVVPFEYDWRMSVFDAAAQLAEKLEVSGGLLDRTESERTPIRIVAHSMGGLVTRALMVNHKKVWNRLLANEGSHTVLLGSPLFGSFDTLNVLKNQTGVSGIVKNFFATGSTTGISDLLGSFPGFLELLPREEIQPLAHNADFGKRDYFKLDSWRESGLDELFAPVKVALELADKQGNRLVDGKWNKDRVTFVHGWSERTPAGIDKSGNLWWSPQGDGVVMWKQPWQDSDQKLRAFWMKESHGAMPQFAEAFSGIRELLERGPKNATPVGLMRDQPDVDFGFSRSAETEQEKWDDVYLQKYSEAEERPEHSHSFEYLPSTRTLETIAVGGRLNKRVESDSETHSLVRVSIAHCDLAFSRSPVATGHYYGDPIVGAERWLDIILGEALSDRQVLGVYPGRHRSCHIELKDGADSGVQGRLPVPRTGAIVVGLGDAGHLTPPKLRDNMAYAFIEYALQAADRYGRGLSTLPLQISSLLIGTGDNAMTYAESMTAIILAVRDANQRLRQTSSNTVPVVYFDALEFVELFDRGAEQALHELIRMESNSAIHEFCEIDRALHRREGHRRQRVHKPEDGWWDRIRIRSYPSGTLKFVFQTNRAVQPQRTQPNQPRLVQKLVQQVIQNPVDSPEFREASNTIFQELIPNALKNAAGDSRGLVLRVDETSAAIPWEALYNRHDRDQKPLSVKTGIIRQLVTGRFREHPKDTTELTAFVVGDPNSEYVELPGAQEEAFEVISRLKAAGITAEKSIRENAVDVVNKLRAADYRVLHLAGHGVHNQPLVGEDEELAESVKRHPSRNKSKKLAALCRDFETTVSGMVLGDGIYLTPQMVEQTEYIPELVFINCCHLGNAEHKDQSGTEPRDDYNQLAANVAIQFIRIGVRAVVAAGWAVNDAAAKTFASAFYREILSGRPFGEAVRNARTEVAEKHHESNTWAAYQCYGDPGWRLQLRKATASGGSQGSRNRYQTPEELIDDLYNTAQKATAAAGNRYTEYLERSLTDIDKHLTNAERADCRVLEGLGLAWAELADFKKAKKLLSEACERSTGQLSLATLDMLVESSYRTASRNQNSGDLMKCLKNLERLVKLAKSRDRFVMQGSVHRRIALLELKGKPEKAKEQLKQAATAYRKAIEHDDSMATSPLAEQKPASWDRSQFPRFCLHLTETLIWIQSQSMDEQSEDATRFDPEAVDEWALRVQEGARQQDEQQPAFWTSAWQGGIPLLRLLLCFCEEELQGNKEAMDDREDLRTSCIRGYASAMKRGCSPRNRCSLSEFLLWTRDFASHLEAEELHTHLKLICDAVLPEAGFTESELTGR